MINLIHKLLLFLHSKKKNQFEQIVPSNILEDSSNVLILLPEEKELISEIKFLVSTLDKIFPNKSFLVESEIQKSLSSTESNSFITYSKEQKNLLRLPKRELIKYLQLKNFDTIIDCNLNDSIFHYWLTKNINAKFKIGLYRKNSTHFNNLVMKIRNIKSIRNVYENFLYLLQL